MTKKEYDEANPILSFRVTKKIFKEVQDIVEGRSKYESGFNRHKYLRGLLEEDLRKLGRL